MNFSHKCHFHPQCAITKFCPQEACTLPLCQICEEIHLQQHENGFQDAKLIRFNEAYLSAINKIQDFIEQERHYNKQLEKMVENDREAVLKFIGNYYSDAIKAVQEAKNKITPLQEKLGKLRKGSIKTLIFFYSGDIKLQKETLKFEPLIQRLKVTKHQTQKDIFQKSNSKAKLENNKPAQHKQLQKREYSYNKYDRVGNDQLSRHKKTAIDDTNVFQRIQEPKIQEKPRQKNRKSIFDNTKKSTIMQPQMNEKTAKYNYTIQNQQDIDMVKASPSFRYLPKYNPNIDEGATNKQLNQKFQPQQPSSNELNARFQNQALSKYRGAEQYEAYKKQREERLFQQLNYHNKPAQEKEKLIFQHKVLKASDLEVEQVQKKSTKIHEKYHDMKQQPQHRNNGEQGIAPTQRVRAMSQANITNRQASKENLGYDLKKQVLPPHQIRKMVEKRIQERNRILSIKKREISGPNEERIARGEAKESIINQLYQAKY